MLTLFKLLDFEKYRSKYTSVFTVREWVLIIYGEAAASKLGESKEPTHPLDQDLDQDSGQPSGQESSQKGKDQGKVSLLEFIMTSGLQCAVSGKVHSIYGTLRDDLPVINTCTLVDPESAHLTVELKSVIPLITPTMFLHLRFIKPSVDAATPASIIIDLSDMKRSFDKLFDPRSATSDLDRIGADEFTLIKLLYKLECIHSRMSGGKVLLLASLVSSGLFTKAEIETLILYSVKCM
jgi:hypothetical protein